MLSEKLSYLKQFRELENLNVNFTNTDDYISKPKLQNIKSKDLDDKQLTTIYLYQSKFYYLYWIEQKEPISLGKKSDIQTQHLAFLENYEYFIEINPLDNHKVIIAFNENSYKILILKANAIICDSIYTITWTTNTSVLPYSLVKRKFTIKDKDILNKIDSKLKDLSKIIIGS